MSSFGIESISYLLNHPTANHTQRLLYVICSSLIYSHDLLLTSLQSRPLSSAKWLSSVSHKKDFLSTCLNHFCPPRPNTTPSITRMCSWLFYKFYSTQCLYRYICCLIVDGTLFSYYIFLLNSKVPENKDHVLYISCLSPMLSSRVFWTYWIEILYISPLYFKIFLSQKSWSRTLEL